MIDNQDNRGECQKSKSMPVSLLGALASRLFGHKSQKADHDKQEKEEFSEKTNKKKMPYCVSSKSVVIPRKPECDVRRFKIRYNSTIGNIMRNWMSLMYSILILRMNLIKFILGQCPDLSDKDKRLSQQILLESKVVYHMVRKAQCFSQERSLFLWTQLEKLVFNRMILKNYVDHTKEKEFSYRDWKSMTWKLEHMQSDFENAQNFLNALRTERNQKQKIYTKRMQSLENLTQSKEKEIERLIEQITQLKKGQMEYHQQIMNNIKTYKDLNAKKKHLQNMEQELKVLKNKRNQMISEFSSKMKALKFDIQDKDNEIKQEIAKKNKLKKALKDFGSV